MFLFYLDSNTHNFYVFIRDNIGGEILKMCHDNNRDKFEYTKFNYREDTTICWLKTPIQNITFLLKVLDKTCSDYIVETNKELVENEPNMVPIENTLLYIFHLIWKPQAQENSKDSETKRMSNEARERMLSFAPFHVCYRNGLRLKDYENAIDAIRSALLRIHMRDTFQKTQPYLINDENDQKRCVSLQEILFEQYVNKHDTCFYTELLFLADLLLFARKNEEGCYEFLPSSSISHHDYYAQGGMFHNAFDQEIKAVLKWLNPDLKVDMDKTTDLHQKISLTLNASLTLDVLLKFDNHEWMGITQEIKILQTEKDNSLNNALATNNKDKIGTLLVLNRNGLFLQHDNKKQRLPKFIMHKILAEVLEEDYQEKPFNLDVAYK